MKKILALSVAVLMLLALTACAGDTPTGSTPAATTTTAKPTAPTTAPTAPTEPSTAPTAQPTEPTAAPTEPPHVHEYTTTVTPPTCTVNGYTLYTCACGDSYRDNFTDTLGHDYENWICSKCDELLIRSPKTPFPNWVLSVLTAQGVSEETINPAEIGKVTVVIFWYTECGYCSQMLVELNQMQIDHPDLFEIVAINNIDYESADTYISEKYPDSNIHFAADTSPDSVQYDKAFKGANGYPYIAILDETGMIVKTVLGYYPYDQFFDILSQYLPK